MTKFLMTAILLLSLMGSAVAEDIPAYSRSLYLNTWNSVSSCINVRELVLIQRSLLDSSVTKTCTVSTGMWIDEYTGATIYSAPSIDIDHVVSLKEAHVSGAYRWSETAKRRFANDPDNLAVTSLSVNRSKGDRNILEWTPADPARRWAYAYRYKIIKDQYNLSYTPAEAALLNAILTQ